MINLYLSCQIRILFVKKKSSWLYLIIYFVLQFLGGLKKLAYLDASKNQIYEVADEIEGCISLCDLTLSSNRIKVLPDGIGKYFPFFNKEFGYIYICIVKYD